MERKHLKFLSLALALVMLFKSRRRERIKAIFSLSKMRK